MRIAASRRHCLACLALITFSAAGCSGGASKNTATERHLGFIATETVGPPSPIGPFRDDRVIEFFCDPRSNCPEITVRGSPIDHPCLPVSGRPVFPVCPVRGVHDASISADQKTGALWLAYTYASLTFAGAVTQDRVMGTHTTRLARSDDGGRIWRTVAEINSGEPFRHTDRGMGVIAHEVPTIDIDADGEWSMLWQQHFNTREQEYNDVVLSSRTAAAPQKLNAARPTSRFSGWSNPTVWAASTNLAELVPDLANCTVFTEPALLTVHSSLYGALECIDWDVTRNRRNIAGSALHLFRFPDGLNGRPQYIGPLADRDDVVALTGRADATLSQASLAQSRIDGRLLLLTSLWSDDRRPTTSGCLVLEIADIAQAELARGFDGAPIVRAKVEADTNPGKTLGPGQCDYDPLSETGVLITYMYEDRESDPIDLRISVHATGVHP